jgi:hypothetical protein
MSTYEQFKELSVTVCKDNAQKPLQWIYAVDDAWLHPADFKIADDIKNPVFTTPGSVTLDEWTSRHQAIFARKKVNQEDDGDLEFKPKAVTNEKENEGDANVANTLIEYALLGKYRSTPPSASSESDPTWNDYGVCFCSFEYFWDNFKVINQPFNAVIFDLNHALRNSGDLTTAWSRKLKATSLFGDTNIDLKNLHGWMCHFAAKLGRIDNLHCRIDPNHILILSSNLMGARASDGTESMQAFQQYATIQRDLWEHISETDTLLLPNSHIIDFSFCPLPKNIEGIDKNARLLDKGLEIFDRTFSKLTSWAYQREALLRDIVTLWHENATTYAQGHFNQSTEIHEVSPAMMFDGWIYRPNYLNDYRAIAFFDDRIACFSEDSFLELLDRAMPLSKVQWTRPAYDTPGPHLNLPMRPGGAFIVALLDFIHAVAAVKNLVTHSAPKVEYLRNGGSSVLKITLNATGVAILSGIHTNGGDNPFSNPAKAGDAIQRFNFPLLIETLMAEIDPTIEMPANFNNNHAAVSMNCICVPSFIGSEIIFTLQHVICNQVQPA